jgi:hypothetical protein
MHSGRSLLPIWASHCRKPPQSPDVSDPVHWTFEANRAFREALAMHRHVFLNLSLVVTFVFLVESASITAAIASMFFHICLC